MTTPHSNRDLRQRVHAELDQDPRVDTEELRIAVHAGVVTVLGHVPNYAQKHIVEDALRALLGVKGVANELEVQLPPGDERPDAALASTASQELRHTVQLPTSAIQVEARDGALILSGTVDWAFQRRRAERALRYLVGLKSIDNRLSVKPHAAPDDLEQQIRQVLDRHAQEQGPRIQVTTDEGAVTVRGTVASWTARDDIGELIWALPGVTDVDNQLTVARTAYA
jgi:osmotically-inducible protein OsmY